LTVLHRATFSYFEKRSYINAVKCLQSLPSITPPSAAPGAKRRFDDFAATHINQTLTIHETVSEERAGRKWKTNY
jgi:tyrosinase